MESRKALESPDFYTIGWITALSIERAAAVAMLDEQHAQPDGFVRHQTDTNSYAWGRIGDHNIVIVSLPAGLYGTTSAATTASNLLSSLPSIRIGLLVGIGGGISRPNEDRDIRLGDIVVSQPDGTTGGICQYDLVKAKLGENRERKGFLAMPPMLLLNSLASIQADHELDDSKVPDLLQEMLQNKPKMAKQSPGWVYQGSDNDRLFKASYEHTSGKDCSSCSAAEEIKRDPRDTTDPMIHYGIIASGNTLVKDATARDRIVADIGEDCICFEMEAAGLMNHFPCLVIRGICDYADSHKNDRWQRYAAATAAAYAKELLAYIPAADVQNTEKALVLVQSMKEDLDHVRREGDRVKSIVETRESKQHLADIERWLDPPNTSTNINKARDLRHEGTGTWLLTSSVFDDWKAGRRPHLWLHALAGCGKTVLTATILENLEQSGTHTTLAFFFDFSDVRKQTLDSLLRSLAFQLYPLGGEAARRLDHLFGSHDDGRKQPSTAALLDCVKSMIRVHDKVTIVLDALDECTTRRELISWIRSFTTGSTFGNAQLIVTARPEQEFQREIPRYFGEESCLLLDKQAINADIRSYVTAQLAQLPGFVDLRLSQGLLERIRNKVGDGADGMFRWAKCQLDALVQCRTPRAIEEALESLPLDLNETYQRMVESIPAELERDAMRLLQFLVHTMRPLTLPEAREVIATQIDGNGEAVDKQVIDPSDLLSLDYDVSILFPSANQIRKCKKCRAAFTQTFTIPDIWWSEYCRNSNGYFGCEDSTDIGGTLSGTRTWCRFLVKQLLGNADGEIAYEWYKLNVFATWDRATGRTAVLVFDLPLSAARRIRHQLLDGLDEEWVRDPFWMYVRLVEEVVERQDRAVWAVRDWVRTIEKSRASSERPRPNYAWLHDIARHSIHVSETLELGTNTVEGILTHYHRVASLLGAETGTGPKEPGTTAGVGVPLIVSRLRFFHDMLRSLHTRSATNKARLQNEIQLVFNMVAQYDARISVEIGRAAQADGAAMRTVAFVTLTFLPATFVCAVFSMSFFDFDAEKGVWSVSGEFWRYWAVAVPVTVVTVVAWFGLERLLRPTPIDGIEGEVGAAGVAVGLRKVLWEKGRGVPA
ncbi:uncharacterized protein DNG_09609 [Cephalotrichum gorgonifer]|uniref:Nephrocystin 3-like N-terminal domain-containing protein n=1 Tax=Cephalotrichum gorgonifer TaxID=2041049 RepID=A0AAE8SZH9_9PEZI|nr:uncharacterized protein DNG_09609 [Cephalotrichum gorgonifer]